MKRKFVVDTSVLAEYLDEESPYGDILERFFSDVRDGKFDAYLTHITIAELVFVATRIYREAGVENPNDEAIKYVTWLTAVAGFRIVDTAFEDSLLAGELRKSMKISIADRFVISTARRLNATPLFLKLEKEMKFLEGMLRKHKVKFIDEIY